MGGRGSSTETYDPGRTRAYGPRLCGPMTYPLGHRTSCDSLPGLPQPLFHVLSVGRDAVLNIFLVEGKSNAVFLAGKAVSSSGSKNGNSPAPLHAHRPAGSAGAGRSLKLAQLPPRSLQGAYVYKSTPGTL